MLSPQRRAALNVLLPWLFARQVFKPKVGTGKKDRLLDRLAFWRSATGLVMIVIATSNYQHIVFVSGNLGLKVVQSGVVALLLPPLAFVVLLLVTRPGLRGTLMPGARRLLARAGLAVAVVVLPFVTWSLLAAAGDGTVTISLPDAGVGTLFLILLSPLLFLWFWCFWGCTLYWAARTGLWSAELHPLLAPVGTTAVMLLVTSLELSEGDAKGVPFWLWLTLNLCGVVSSLTLAVLEYRHLRKAGHRWREGPDQCSRTTGAPPEQTIVSSTSSPSSGSNSTFASPAGPGSTPSTL
ncbi:hypothetical protein AB0K12_10305 [Nonomuraea sp. NPDC049419]|uniref:hypothetical protein n=1 Tax=Nonomuraea sp. NPDC049419 TaxID=3155772 RepID=UPI0034425E1F